MQGFPPLLCIFFLTFWATTIILRLWATKSEVKNLSPKTGRPKAENPKSNPIHVRLDDKTLAILDKYCKRTGKKRTEGIRDGITLLEKK